MKKSALFILIAFLFFNTFENFAYGSLKVTPTLIELDTKNIKNSYITTSFDIKAEKDETIRFKIYPQYFKITPEGKMEISEKNNQKDSLVNNIHFVPSEFTLRNGKAQKIRLTINNLKKLNNGESRLVLFLEDVKAKEVNIENNYKNVSTRLLVKTRIGIPIYLDNGLVNKKGEIDSIELEKIDDGIICNTKIISSGNSKIRYDGKIQIIKDKNLISEHYVNKNVVGAKNYLIAKDKIPFKNLKENEQYKLRVILSYKDENKKNKNMIKETTFMVTNDTISI